MNKHIPTRMCMVCRERHLKPELLRIVKKDGVYFYDPTQKADGRGAYLCKSKECREKFLKSRALNRTFKEEVSQEFYAEILNQIELDEQV